MTAAARGLACHVAEPLCCREIISTEAPSIKFGIFVDLVTPQGDVVAPDNASLQLYFARCKLEPREVALVELEEALRQAGNQSQLYGQLANVLLGVATIVGSLLAATASPTLSNLTQPQRITVSAAAFLLLGALLVFFAELQKTITLNSRKVVTLRGALGLDYTHLQLTLPSWRIEGATNPFAIRMFPGWRSATALPFWVVSAVTSCTCCFVLKDLRFTLLADITIPWWGTAHAVFVFFAILFRKRLLDIHETLGLRFIYRFAALLRIRLLPDCVGTLFRAKLAVSELQRLAFDTSRLKQVLIALEDHRFKSHAGVDLRALGRAALSGFRRYRRSRGIVRSGASTITMQLARTLLVADYNKTARRKVLEVLLARWLEHQFNKDEILDLYLVSVRFAPRVFGVPAALAYYFGATHLRFTSDAQAFILVERLSNVRNIIRAEKVAAQLRLARDRIPDFDPTDAVSLYQALVSKRILVGDCTALARADT